MMRFKFIALVLFALAAAEPSQADWLSTWTPGQWVLCTGECTGKALSTHPDEAACHAAGDALAAKLKKAPTYGCMRLDIGTYAVPPVVPPVVPDWSKIADENGAFTLAEPQYVQYGAGTSWIKKALDKGTYTCGNALFSDPAPNVVKECDLHSGPAIVLPPAPIWKTVAAEGQTFFVADRQFVRYGIGSAWVVIAVKGAAACVADFFNKDPMPFVAKTCEINTNAQVIIDPDPTPPVVVVPPDPSVPHMHGGIQVPAEDLFPPTTSGHAEERVAATTDVGLFSDIGAFREPCNFAKMAFDDPIVYPGQPGASHLHTFFGNTGIDANSTTETLMSTGSSSCAGGVVNRTAYWVPTLIDTGNGALQPIYPLSNLIYYKTGYDGVRNQDIQPFPDGLKFISGSPSSAAPETNAGRWSCDTVTGNTGWRTEIPNDCKPGTGLLMTIEFPQCWDGKNLDSANHKDHMAFANGKYVLAPTDGTQLQSWQEVTTTAGCPASHPIALPLISYNIWYQVPWDHPERIQMDWRLSCDTYDKSLPGGYCIHGDYFLGWKREIMEAWVKNCNVVAKDCHAFLLGDGRALY